MAKETEKVSSLGAMAQPSKVNLKITILKDPVFTNGLQGKSILGTGKTTKCMELAVSLSKK